jgi:hypothetical protein
VILIIAVAIFLLNYVKHQDAPNVAQVNTIIAVIAEVMILIIAITIVL